MNNLLRIGMLLLAARLVACSGPTSAIPSTPTAPIVQPPVYTPQSTTVLKPVHHSRLLAQIAKTAPVGSVMILKAP